MDKRIELVCVNAAYAKQRRSRGVRFVSSESPDFLCQRAGKTIFGVEVTELYHNEGAARITKLKGYSTDILRKKAYRHKDDVNFLPIRKALYDPKGKDPIEFEGIVQYLPTFLERAALLGAVISTKERKVAAYQRNAPAIDLVVYDPTRLLSFNDFVQFFPAFSHAVGRARILNSPFREIFLLVKKLDGEVTLIALKLNVVAAEIFAFEILIRRSQFCRNQRDKSRSPFYLVSALRLVGFGSIKVTIHRGVLCFLWGPWMLRYERSGKSIRDTILYRRPPFHAEDLETAVPSTDLSSIELKFVRALIKKRTKIAACYPLAFETAMEGNDV